MECEDPIVINAVECEGGDQDMMIIGDDDDTLQWGLKEEDTSPLRPEPGRRLLPLTRDIPSQQIEAALETGEIMMNDEETGEKVLVKLTKEQMKHLATELGWRKSGS